MNAIGVLNEKSLHSALKDWCARPGDRLETPLDGYIIDIFRDGLLIEIQTRNFSAIKSKLLKLTAQHPVRLVYPIAREKWILRLPTDEAGMPRRRKSPKRGALFQIFDELVSFPELLANPNFSLQILSIHEEEMRRHDKRHGWRRGGWVTQERRLIEVTDEHLFEDPENMAPLIPADLPVSFTTADLAQALKTSRRLAQKMAYCLDRMNLFERAGKRGNAIVYRRKE